MIGVVGDLVEDIAVRLLTAINVASDTEAVIRRRRGGSAANTAVAIARLGRRARFIGQVGDDAVGTMSLAALTEAQIDIAVRRGGRSGTIVVLLDATGERSMLTDRGACTELDDADPTWLDGLSALHVPLYSLVGQPLAATTHTLVRWAHERGVQVSVDASSAAVIVERGVDATIAELTALAPDVLFCNELEAATLGGIQVVGSIARRAAVVKQGPAPSVLVEPGLPPIEIEVPALVGVVDTTGAGDAFSAGFLTAWSDGASATAAVVAGHASAQDAIVLASTAMRAGNES